MAFEQQTSLVTAWPSASPAFSTPPAAGNAVFVVGSVYPAWNGALTGVVVTDNRGNTYNVVTQVIRSSGDAMVFIAHALNVATGSPFTATATPQIASGAADANISALAFEFSGVQASGALDQSASVIETYGALTLSTPAATDTANELVVAMYGVRPWANSFTDLGYPSGYTGIFKRLVNGDGPGAAAFKVVSSTGVQSVTWPDYTGNTFPQAAIIRTFRLGAALTPMRALTLSNGVLTRVASANLGTGLKPLVLLSDGTRKLRATTEGIPLIFDGTSLRTLASTESLEI